MMPELVPKDGSVGAVSVKYIHILNKGKRNSKNRKERNGIKV